ncbi:helix-turn-helix domain-containing protein [Enterococcus sp. 22-H-5-01]|uniref:helix-turn-helix domain-containing protein n=1 Tax=Enterococcus sp. 22-H-5-01 TaxID=3418555 RepID=UPI003D0607DA
MEIAKDAYLKMRIIRKDKGVTQAHIAKKLGFSSSQAYANIEYGKTDLKFDVAVRVAEILNVSVYDFLGEKIKQ